MRAVLQRVSTAGVLVGANTIGHIGDGLLVLVGVHREDTEREAKVLAQKTAGLRIFEDDEGKMNRSLLEVGGSALVVSNFTLYADTRKGRRPSFNESAPYAEGEALYEAFCDHLRAEGVPVQTGSYGAMMQVNLTNSGPVTIIMDTRDW